MTRQYIPTETRREQILAAALSLATSHHYLAVTRDEIADAVGTATGNVSRIFGTMGQLRNELLRYAVAVECLPVIAQAVAAGDKAVKGLPAALKRRAVMGLV